MAATNQVHEWSRQVQIVQETTYGTDPGTGYTKVVLEGRPMVSPGLDGPKDVGAVGSGLAERRALDVTFGKYAPIITGWKQRYNEILLGKYLRGLFQSLGTATGAGPYTNTFSIYTAQPSTPRGLTVLATSEPGTVEGESLTGVVCTQIKLSGSDDGNPLYMEPTLMGKTFSTPTVATSTSFFAPAFYGRFWDVVCKFAGTATPIFAFELTLNTNMHPEYYNNRTPQDWVLGSWIDTGSVTIAGKGAMAGQYGSFFLDAETASPYGQKLTFEIGTSGSSGFFKWERDVIWSQPTPGKTPGGVETWTFPFRTALKTSSSTTTLLSLTQAAALT